MIDMKKPLGKSKRHLTGKMCKLYDKYCYVNHFWCDEVNAEDCYIRKAYEQGKKEAYNSFNLKLGKRTLSMIQADTRKQTLSEVLKEYKMKWYIPITLKSGEIKKEFHHYEYRQDYNFLKWLETELSKDDCK